MADSWRDNSELVGGLVITGRISSNTVRPEIFCSPIDEVIKLYKSGTVGVEELSEICGFSIVSTLLEAASSVNGTLNKLDWIKKLEMSFSSYTSGDELEKLGKKLKKGEQIDFSKLTTIAAKAQTGQSTLVRASDIEPKGAKFILSGYKPVDDHLLGIPEVGLLLVGGRPGTGKTTLLVRMIKSFLAQHKDKTVATFSIEMLAEEIRKRADEIVEFTQDELERWIICDEPYTAEQIINKAATIDNLGFIGIDFADMMIIGESNESKYTELYKSLALGAKSLRVPIMLLAQFSGSYTGGVPKPEHFRWTRLAEALAWEIWTIWNPDKDYFADDEDLLPAVEGKSYICVWKIRGGYRLHMEDNPGAIQIPYKNDLGWHPTTSKWFVMKVDKPKKQYTKR